MNYANFKHMIVNSEPSDWIYDDEKSTYIFKPDLSISIVGQELDYTESGLFQEDWATHHPDPHARRKLFDLCFNGNAIETFYTVAVDGLRMYIPYPELATMTISQEQYSIGKIVNIPMQGYDYNNYLSRCDISVN